MSYNPTNWSDGDLVTSAKLNKIEQGIADIQGIKVVQANTSIRLTEVQPKDGDPFALEHLTTILEITPNELSEMFNNKQIIFVFNNINEIDRSEMSSSSYDYSAPSPGWGVITNYYDNLECGVIWFEDVRGMQYFSSSNLNEFFVYSDEPNNYENPEEDILTT